MPRRRFTSLVLFGAVVLALAAFVLLRRTPTWFAPPPRNDPGAVATGERLESAVIEQFTRVRPEEEPTWAIACRDEAANAWLATRLPRWIEHLGAADPGALQLRFLPGAIEIGVSRPGAPFASARLAPTVIDGALRLQVVGGGVASLRMPGSAAALIAERLTIVEDGADAEWVAAARSLLAGESVPARVDLGDGRLVEVVDVEVLPGELRARLRTLPR